MNWRLLLMLLPLLAACNQPEKGTVQAYPAMDSAAFLVFKQQCSLCHAPPLPSKHRAKAWPTVVARMIRHRAERGSPPLSANDQAQILQYLQQYAAEPI